jgi:DNA repair exonuclease SbcCD ATPase subunit
MAEMAGAAEVQGNGTDSSIEHPSLRSEGERLKLERDNAQLRADLAQLNRPWWRKGSIVTTMTALIASVVPVTTAVQAHYEKERELALQESKQAHEIRTSYLDRLDKPGARPRTLRFVIATTDDPVMKRWALEETRADEIAQQAQETVDQLSQDMRDQDARLSAAEEVVRTARADAERQSAQANLDRLRQHKLEMEKRIQEARNAAAKAERAKGMHISRECLDNPLAKGC